METSIFELQKKMAHRCIPGENSIINIRVRYPCFLSDGADKVVDGVDNEFLEFLKTPGLLCVVDPRDDVFSAFDLLIQA